MQDKTQRRTIFMKDEAFYEVKDGTVYELRDTGVKADTYRMVVRAGVTKGDTKKVIRKTLTKAGASASQRKRAIDDVSEELGIRWNE